MSTGGDYAYDEQTFQRYANQKYASAFAYDDTYEDNILLVVLTTEDAQEYYCIGWVGDHIDTDVNLMFGGEGTALERAFSVSLGSDYKYSLSKGLAMATEQMAAGIVATGNADPFTCKEDHNLAESKVYNYSSYSITESTVNDALAKFTADTGITMSIVVEDAEDVFETNYSAMIFGLIIVGALVAISIVLIVKSVKKNKGGRQNNYSKNDYANGNFKL